MDSELAVQSERFSIYVDRDVMKIEGNIDLMRPQEILEPFFEKVHAALMEQVVKRIKVDVKLLKYINSSGIKEIVRWVLKLNNTSPDKRYKIVFQCNPNCSWQSTIFASFAWSNQGYLEIE